MKAPVLPARLLPSLSRVLAFAWFLGIAMPARAVDPEPAGAGTAAATAAARKERYGQLGKEIFALRKEERAARAAVLEVKAKELRERRHKLEAEFVPLVYGIAKEGYGAGLKDGSMEKIDELPLLNEILLLEADTARYQQQLDAGAEGKEKILAEAVVASNQRKVRDMEAKAIFETAYFSCVSLVAEAFPAFGDPQSEFARRYRQREAELKEKKDRLLENPCYPVEIADELAYGSSPVPFTVPSDRDKTGGDSGKPGAGSAFWEEEIALKTAELEEMKRKGAPAAEIEKKEAVIRFMRRQQAKEEGAGE